MVLYCARLNRRRVIALQYPATSVLQATRPGIAPPAVLCAAPSHYLRYCWMPPVFQLAFPCFRPARTKKMTPRYAFSFNRSSIVKKRKSGVCHPYNLAHLSSLSCKKSIAQHYGQNLSNKLNMDIKLRYSRSTQDVQQEILPILLIHLILQGIMYVFQYFYVCGRGMSSPGIDTFLSLRLYTTTAPCNGGL